MPVLLTLTVLFAALAAQPALGFDQGQEKAAEKQSTKRARSVSLTGCVDQQDGKYILVDDHGLNRIAALEPDGFPTEGFAKHVGHKVTVRGTSSADGNQTQFRVRTIEMISETCTSQEK